MTALIVGVELAALACLGPVYLVLQGLRKNSSRPCDRSMYSLEAILIWLFVINLGIAFGAGLYEARVVIPQWLDLPPTSWPNTGLMFWIYVTTIPLTLLTLANLIVAWMNRSIRRKWWLSAAAIAFLERLVTFSYFIPTMICLMTSELPEPEVKATLSQWLLFNHGRHVLTFAAWLMALKTLSLPAKHRG